MLFASLHDSDTFTEVPIPPTHSRKNRHNFDDTKEAHIARPARTIPNDHTEYFSDFLMDPTAIPAWLDDVITGSSRATTSTTQDRPLIAHRLIAILATIPEITVKAASELLQSYAGKPVSTRIAQLYVSSASVILTAVANKRPAQQYL